MDPALAPAPFLPPSPMPNLPQLPNMGSGGMFGGGSRFQDALMAAAAGFLARRSPGMAESLMSGVQQKRILNRQSQLAMLQSNLEFERQMRLLPIQYQMRLLDNPFVQTEIQAGVMPGTPQFATDAKTHQQNELDPIVTTPY